MVFRIGQEVVCVNARASNNYGLTELIEGKIYTIKWTNGPHVRLVEMTLRNAYGDDTPYCVSRFRPLTDTKSSISFTMGAPLDSEQWDGRKGKVRA